MRFNQFNLNKLSNPGCHLAKLLMAIILFGFLSNSNCTAANFTAASWQEENGEAAMTEEEQAAAEEAEKIKRLAARKIEDERDAEAWEYRPYRLAVWIAHDNSWRLRAAEERIIDQLGIKMRLADRSSWRINVRRAPKPWNWRLLGNFDRELYSNDMLDEIRVGDQMPDADKLMIVKIRDKEGMIETVVQELDLKTLIFGAEVVRLTDMRNLEQTLFNSVRTAFMPMTRIEFVNDLEVRVKLRAASIIQSAVQDKYGDWKMIDNVGSPTWIKDDEILLPVILRTDRRGNLESITPIYWTFLSIIRPNFFGFEAPREGSRLFCKTHAMKRTPLGGRTGGRTERIALCVRAPNRETTLKLVSNDKEQVPLADLEVYSRRIGMSIDEDSEFLGKSDWRGYINVPPNDDSLRLLFVKSGRRPLARVPVVPGLYESQTTAMPNDEARLYAEGVIRGLENRLMDNLARRQVLAVQIEKAFEDGNLERADELVQRLLKVDNADTFTSMLSDKKHKLLSGDDRQRGFILQYFEQLETAAYKFLDDVETNKLSKDVSAAMRMADSRDGTRPNKREPVKQDPKPDDESPDKEEKTPAEDDAGDGSINE